MSQLKLAVSHRLATVSLAILLNGMLIWQFLPGDLLIGGRALIMALVTVLFQLVVVNKNKSPLNKRAGVYILMMLLQVCVFTFSLFISSFPEYGMWKVQGFLVFSVMPAFFIVWNYWQRPFLIESFLRWLLVFSALPAFLILMDTEMLEPGFFRYSLNQLGVDVIGTERSLGLGVLIATIFAIRAKGWRRMFFISASAPLLIMMLMIGERGPVLALLFSITYVIAVLVSTFRRLSGGARVLISAIVFIVAALLLPILVPRFSAEALSSDGRWSVFAAALTQLGDSPFFGTGLGAFSPDPSTTGGREYFHNIFGEILTEVGVLGFGIMLLLFVLPFLLNPIRFSKISEEMRPWLHTSVALFIYAFINANVSGDLATNYFVWVGFALIFCCGYPKTLANMRSGHC
ncbi:O-antigen ligase family protein [Massilia aerilata]|uniref:O-antigen ligase family protein n=1 Tax=Massilia aerilata TaxID=453817 RepID=A0ABW0RTG1_9BURK